MTVETLRFVHTFKVFIMIVVLGKFSSKCLRKYKCRDIVTGEGPDGWGRIEYFIYNIA